MMTGTLATPFVTGWFDFFMGALSSVDHISNRMRLCDCPIIVMDIHCTENHPAKNRCKHQNNCDQNNPYGRCCHADIIIQILRLVHPFDTLFSENTAHNHALHIT